jgi:hypothetical protein
MKRAIVKESVRMPPPGGRDIALRCPRRRAKRQATERSPEAYAQHEKLRRHYAARMAQRAIPAKSWRKTRPGIL